MSAEPVFIHIATGPPNWSLLQSLPVLAGDVIVLDLIRVNIRNDWLAPRKQRVYSQDPHLAADDPLSQLPFIDFCQAHINNTSRSSRCSRGGYTRVPVGALRRCSVRHTLASYLKVPHIGDTTEQLCILHWKSEKDRERLKKGDWWNSVFQKKLEEAQWEGDALDVDCISIAVQDMHHCLRDSTAGVSSAPASRRRWLANLLCFQRSN